jgi:ribosome maturation factor RimP
VQQRVEISTLFFALEWQPYVRSGVLHDSVLESNIKREIGPIVQGSGFKIVELKVGRSHKSVRVTIVVYSKEGVGIDDLSSLSRMIRPRIELMSELRDFTLVCTSPGIDREIKDRSEYAIFKGKGVKVLLNDESDWLGGIIDDGDERYLHLRTSQGLKKIDFEMIRKAKLDYDQEVGSLEHVR